MFKGHPKGLFVLALTNMGERFGYYTMLAIFALYLQARFGFTPTQTSLIYSTFLAMVYFLPLFGGFMADRFLGYGKTVIIGIGVMFGGYALLALPVGGMDTMGFSNTGFYFMIMALFLIALGTGFFKGNLQALTGNIYDAVQYSAKRDVAFSIFYMFINIGAFFAPSAAEAVSNYVLRQDNLKYEAKVPDLALKYLNYTVTDSATFRLDVINAASAKGKEIDNIEKYIKQQKKKKSVLYQTEYNRISLQLEQSGKQQLGTSYNDIRSFAKKYTQSLAKSYRWGFAVACFSLIISIAIFLIFKKTHAHADKSERQKAKDKNLASEVIKLTPQQTRQRLIALGLVFFVVIFFWMSFHQNGLCMTFFARDYTILNIGPGLSIWFTLKALLPAIIGFYGLMELIQNKKRLNKIIGGSVFLAAIAIIWYIYSTADASTSITPPIFQQFNPFFIVILTPIFVTFFAWLGNKGKEPSAPRKIGIGMLIAALGFVILIFASFGQPAPAELEGTSQFLVSPNWLISTYFVLTIAELFLSPMGISFVSRVAPPQYKGLMQGGWFAATAIGNYLVGVMGVFWDKLALWSFWAVLVICCLLSAMFIFSVMGRLERATTTKPATT
ncbi:MAG: peptide MFS transporter [Bacteroidetes bacterium]|nr:peptide MFS transporter [Bacteroidota bacterium]